MEELKSFEVDEVSGGNGWVFVANVVAGVGGNYVYQSATSPTGYLNIAGTHILNAMGTGPGPYPGAIGYTYY